jgi:hypothetical protein
MSNLLKMFRPCLSWLGRNALATVTFWLLSLGLVQFGERVLGGWPASEAGQLVGCIAGIAVALKLRARATAYLLAGLAAFSTSELAIHFYYGIRALQGAPSHFAVMAAGVVGALLGALLASNGGDVTRRLARLLVNRAAVQRSDTIERAPDNRTERRSNIALEPPAPALM